MSSNYVSSMPMAANFPQATTMIPYGFEASSRNVCCPSCRGSLIRKLATYEDTAMLSSAGDAGVNCLIDDDADEEIQHALTSSLESARCANLLLQAMSFDLATRGQFEGHDMAKKNVLEPISGVSYCPICRVHVITDVPELEKLFDWAKISSQKGSSDEAIEESLSGGLYVVVDEAEVSALLQRRKKQKVLKTKKVPEESFVKNEEDEEQNTIYSTQESGSYFPTKPCEFEYAYRHKVATKAMGAKMGQGYTLLETTCPECEMPLMQFANKEAECVVCPKLFKKLAKLQLQSLDSKRLRPDVMLATSSADQNAHENEAIRNDTEKNDPVSHILANAWSATNVAKPSQNNTNVSEAKAFVQDNRIAEAKNYLQKNRLRHDSSPGTLPHHKVSQQPICVSPTEALPHPGTVPDVGIDNSDSEKLETHSAVDWETLVANGRVLLSERLVQGWTMVSENCVGPNCKGTPLTNFHGGPNSCVVCGGSGSGLDGAYAAEANQSTETASDVKSEEVKQVERELVSREISQLMTMGWVLRDSLCEQCLMPLVAEHVDSDDLCILCGSSPLVQHGNANEEVSGSSHNASNVQRISPHIATIVNSPVPTFSDDRSNDAGEKLLQGWTLPSAPLCPQCSGIQMVPPNSTECGCINRRCPSALAAAYSNCPTPTSSSAPKQVIGRGAVGTISQPESLPVTSDDQAGTPLETLQTHQTLNPRTPPREHQQDPSIGERSYHSNDGFPYEVGGTPMSHSQYDDPSVLSDDMSQIRSVASSALGAILVRLDDAKSQLEILRERGDADPQECAEKQVEIATLIEKLASAAVAVKNMEEVEEY